MTVQHKTIALDDGFRVGVTQAGPRDGVPLVFMHGWSVSAKAYEELIELLAEHGFRVTALDAADHGRTSALPWGHSVRDMALVVRRALDRIHVMGPAVVVGHSLGGGMAVEYAAAYPGNVSAAILIDAAAGQKHHEALQMALTPEGVLRAAELITGALRDIIGDTRLAAQSRSVTELLSLGKRLAKSMSGLPMLRAGVALLKHDTAIALHKMKIHHVPTVVIHGGDDRIISERAAYQAACESGGKLEILHGHNHSWMIADPARAAAHITRWARSVVRKTA